MKRLVLKFYVGWFLFMSIFGFFVDGTNFVNYESYQPEKHSKGVLSSSAMVQLGLAGISIYLISQKYDEGE